MLSHVTVGVADSGHAKRFYDVVFAPLGLPPHYHPDYYGAYFRDPDGKKVCVVCHDPPDA